MCAQESERKAYNPRPFCKTYTMDKQPLNTGEQKDMTEFFTDLITKIEEMSQDLVRYPSVCSFVISSSQTRLMLVFVSEKHSENTVRRRHH